MANDWPSDNEWDEEGLLDEAGDDGDPTDWDPLAAASDDFPEEEYDEENPDWYRLPDPDDGDPEEGDPGGGDPDERREFDELKEDAAGEDADELVGPAGEHPRARHASRPFDGAAKRWPCPEDEPGLDFFYDDAGYFGYVLLRRRAGELTRVDLRRVEAALRAASIRVVRGGRSHQPASNGIQYGWYLRVQGPRGAKPAAPSVEEVLRPFRPARAPFVRARDGVPARGAADPHAPPQRLAALEAQLVAQHARGDMLERELTRARAALDAAVDREQRIARRLHETEDELIGRIRQLLDRVAALQRDAATGEDRARAAHAEYAAIVVLLEQERRRREEDHRQLDAARQESQVFADPLDRETERSATELWRLQARVADLEQELETYAAEEVRLVAELAELRDARARGKARVDIGQLLGAVLPNVDFLRGSFDVMLTELRDFGPVLGLIRVIATSGTCPGQKKLVGIPGWMEAHYRTGQSDDGRLYFARGGSGGGWKVLVSRKTSRQEQARDVAYLRRVQL